MSANSCISLSDIIAKLDSIADANGGHWAGNLSTTMLTELFQMGLVRYDFDEPEYLCLTKRGDDLHDMATKARKADVTDQLAADRRLQASRTAVSTSIAKAKKERAAKQRKCRKHTYSFVDCMAYSRKNGTQVTLTQLRCTECGKRVYQNERGNLQARPQS